MNFKSHIYINMSKILKILQSSFVYDDIESH